MLLHLAPLYLKAYPFPQVEPSSEENEISHNRLEPSGAGWGAGGRARARLDAGGAHAGLLGGSPLTLLQGIIPGWFGSYSWAQIAGFGLSTATRVTQRKLEKKTEFSALAISTAMLFRSRLTAQ